MTNLIKILCICGVVGFAAPAFAQVSLDVRFGPPVPRAEVVVAAPFPGAVWVPGYYVFDAGIHNYVWVHGLWQHPPYAGAVWVGPRYVAGHGGYNYFGGHWQARGVNYSRGGYRGGYHAGYGGRASNVGERR